MKKYLVTGLMLVLLMPGIMGVSIANANLIVNGTFEDGKWTGNNSYTHIWAGSTDLTGWTVIGEGVDWHTNNEFYPILNASGVSDSTGHALDLNLSGVTGSILTQSFVTVPNQTYTLRFSMAAPTPGDWGTDERQVRVNLAGNTQFFSMPQAYNRNLIWKDFSMDFTANSTNTSLGFSSMNGGYWGAVLDNISVESTVVTPEPASIILFGLGGAAMALRRRFRQKV